MSKSIFQATLYDQDVPDAGAETKDNEESGDSSCYSEGEDPPSESSRAEGQPRAAMQEDLASNCAEQQAPPQSTPIRLPRTGLGCQSAGTQ